MNYKVAEICDIFIYYEVTLEMQTADSRKASFYSCAENVEIKVTDITFTLFIFVAERVENELIFKHLWKWVIEINISNQADEFIEWTIHNSEKKVVFLDYLSETTLLCAEKDIFSATLN